MILCLVEYSPSLSVLLPHPTCTLPIDAAMLPAFFVISSVCLYPYSLTER